MFKVDNTFQGWYYTREAYLHVYGEPSDSQLREWNAEVTAFKEELDVMNGPQETYSANDNSFKMFLEFAKDVSDEQTVTSNVITYYYDMLNEYSQQNTCGVMGMITGCIQTDNYEEALQIINLYQQQVSKAQVNRWSTYEEIFDEQGEVKTYVPEPTTAATARILRVMTEQLYGDEPELDACVALATSFYTELLEMEQQGKLPSPELTLEQQQLIRGTGEMRGPM